MTPRQPSSSLLNTPQKLGSASWCLPVERGLRTPFEFSSLFPSFSPIQPVAPLVSYTLAGTFSPRLGYGLLGSSPQFKPPETILNHYFVAGPNFFAMRLYKDTIILVLKVLRGERNVPGFTPSIFRYRSRYEKFAHFVSTASGFFQQISLDDTTTEAQAEDRSYSAGSQSSLLLFGPSYPEMTSPLRLNIQQDMMAKEIGHSVAESLDPWNTQKYLQSKLGLELNASTVRVAPKPALPATEILGSVSEDPVQFDVEPWYKSMYEGQEAMDSCFYPPTQNEVHEELNPYLLDQLLAEKLIKSAVCFGECPLFFKGNIDATANKIIVCMNDLTQGFGLSF